MNRDGFIVYQKDTDLAAEAVKHRASFEMSCPADDLTVVVLNTYSAGTMVNQMGVSGCGQKLVYLRLPGNNWALNGGQARSN